MDWAKAGGKMLGDFLEEPQGYFEADAQRSTVEHRREGKEGRGTVVELQLIPRHSLWAHCLWSGGKAVARWMDGELDNDESSEGRTCGRLDVVGKAVLDLGAGAGLTSIVAALNGAARVVATDYPESAILDNLRHNLAHNLISADATSVTSVEGHLWGDERLPSPGVGAFDVVIMADVLANHSAHRGLARSCARALKPRTGVGYVAFCHHRPWLAHKDLEFFDVALHEFGLVSAPLFDLAMDPMFRDDPGSLDVRSHVFVRSLVYSPPQHD